MTTLHPTAGLTAKQIKAGWEHTFSTNNPFCPCDLKSFTKAVNWAERALAATAPNAGAPLPLAPKVPGLLALTRVVATLREDGRFVDEEGEETDALDDLIAAVDAQQALPMAPSGAAFVYHCRAWGESDPPASELLLDLAAVGDFMVREWLGDADHTHDDGTLTLSDLHAQWKGQNWEKTPMWVAKFEIGGVSVERLILPAATRAQAASDVKGDAS